MVGQKTSLKNIAAPFQNNHARITPESFNWFQEGTGWCKQIH